MEEGFIDTGMHKLTWFLYRKAEEVNCKEMKIKEYD